MIKIRISEEEILEIKKKYKEIEKKGIAFGDLSTSFLQLCILVNQEELSKQLDELETHVLDLKLN